MIRFEPPAMNSIKDGIIMAKKKAKESKDVVLTIINDIELYISNETTVDECLKNYFELLKIKHTKDMEKCKTNNSK